MPFVRGCHALLLVLLCFLCWLSIPASSLQAQSAFIARAKPEWVAENEALCALKLQLLLNNVVLNLPWRMGLLTRTAERLPANYLPLPPGGSEVWFKNGDGSSWAVLQIFPIEQIPGAGAMDIRDEVSWKKNEAGVAGESFDPMARIIIPRLEPSNRLLADNLRHLLETHQIVSVKWTVEPKTITFSEKVPRLGGLKAIHYWVLSALHVNTKAGPTTLTLAGQVVGNGHYGLRFGWVTVLKFKYMEQMLKAISASSNSL